MGLHGLLVRVAAREVGAGMPRRGSPGAELDDLAHQAAADAYDRDHRQAETPSAARAGSPPGLTGSWCWRCPASRTHYRRLHPSASLDAEDWDRLPHRFGLDPGEQAVHAEIIMAIRHAVDRSSPPASGGCSWAVVISGIPLDAVVAQTGYRPGTSIYKAIFDARRKIRSFLVANGYLEQEKAGDRAMTDWTALERFLDTDPADVGCEQAMDILHVYADLLAAGADAAQQTTPAWRPTWPPAAPAARTSAGLLAAITQEP